MRHTHRAVGTKRRQYGFSRCARPVGCAPESHGNVTVYDVCSCGAIRVTNRNQGHEERGEWAEVKYAHFSNFGAAVQPQEADATGFLAYRDGFQGLPQGLWTASERYIDQASERIEAWRAGDTEQYYTRGQEGIC